MIALLLAQLVMPSPSVEPLEPPGMICMGECGDGPVVWRASPARGRLVVACDMTSDTCSDGRKITTTRATPVPCEVSPGVWEMVPEDEGCYGVRGLESWASTTTYLSWGAELDRSPWGPSPRGGAIEAIADGWRVYKDLSEPNSGWAQRLTGMGDGTIWTTSYILRTMTPIPMAMYAGSSQSCGQETLDTGGQWQTLSCSREVPAPADPVASIYPGGNTTGTPYSVDAKAAWVVRGTTPGRACWGGEAPVTCAADRHTISTDGWPTEAGEICLTTTIGRASGTAVILDGRPGFVSQGPLLSMTPSGRIDWTSSGTTLQGPVVPKGVAHVICAGRRDGKLTLSVNGVSVPPIDGPALAWEPMAVLGDSVGATPQHIDGTIGPIRIRSSQ